MFAFLPQRYSRCRKLRVGKCANGNAILAGSKVCVPIDRTAADRTKVKVDRSGGVLYEATVDFFRSLNTNLRLVEIRTSVHDGACPSLASLAVANIDDDRFATDRGAKRTAMTGRYSFHGHSRLGGRKPDFARLRTANKRLNNLRGRGYQFSG
jgi:hypothetical protein